MAALKPDTRAAVPAPKRPKDRLAWLVKQGHVPAEHLELGERLLKLHEARLREPSPRMSFGEGSGGGGGSPALARVSARQRWERQFAVAGPTGEAIIGAVLIDGMRLGEAAKALQLPEKAMLHMLRFTLDVLART